MPLPRPPPASQVKRLLPDPPSLRGITYARDPAIVLDDVILRPPSAPSSPAKAAPLGMAAAAAAGGAAAGGVTDMEVDGGEAPTLPAVPLNQQRKEAIRAKSASGGGGGGTPSALVVGGLAAALQAASLQPLAAVREAKGSGAAPAPAAAPASIRAAPASGGQQQLDWLSNVFGKVREEGASAAETDGVASIWFGTSKARASSMCPA